MAYRPPKILDASVGMRRTPVKVNRRILDAQRAQSGYSLTPNTDSAAGIAKGSALALKAGLERVIQVGLEQTLNEIGQRRAANLRGSKRASTAEPNLDVYWLNAQGASSEGSDQQLVAAQYALLENYARRLEGASEAKRKKLYAQLAKEFMQLDPSANNKYK